VPTFDFGVNPHGYHFRFHPLFYRQKFKEKDHLVIAPILWNFNSKEKRNLVVFPLYWQFNDLKREDKQRIVFPFWWQFDDNRKKNYSRVAFPFFWDFQRENNKKRFSLVAPVFWKLRNTQNTTTGVFNVFLNKGKIKKNPFWTFNIFPFLAFGSPPSPKGAYWSFLSGFVGWRRQGQSKQLKLLWIPIDINK